MIVNHKITRALGGKYSTLNEYALEVNNYLFLIVIVGIFKICLLWIDNRIIICQW